MKTPAGTDKTDTSGAGNGIGPIAATVGAVLVAAGVALGAMSLTLLMLG